MMDKHSNNEFQEPQQEPIAPSEVSIVAVSMGTQLRQARESKRMTVEQIAAEMRLAVSVIHDIENDNLGTLPPTFIKGYGRSYAKLVGLDPDALVAQYSAGHEAESHNPFYRSSIENEHSAPRASATQSFRIPWLADKINRSDVHWAKFLNARYLSYAAAALVVLIGVIVWSNHSSEHEQAPPAGTSAMGTLPAQSTDIQPQAATQAAAQSQEAKPASQHSAEAKESHTHVAEAKPSAPQPAPAPAKTDGSNPQGGDDLASKLNMDD